MCYINLKGSPLELTQNSFIKGVLEMYKKILSFILAILCIISCGVIGVSAEDTDSFTNILYFRVPESWGNHGRIYCHITILDTGVSFKSWQSKKERCTQVEGNLYAYDLTQADIEIMDECSVVFSSDTGKETHPLMLRYDGIGDVAYCDGTTYENTADSNKIRYAAFWENKEPDDAGPVVMITESGEPVGICKSQHNQTNEIFFENFIRYGLTKAQELTEKTDQQLIDDILDKLGISDFRADIVINKVGNVVLEWGKGYGLPEKPDLSWEYKEVNGEIVLTGFSTKEDVIDIPETIDGKPVTGIDSSSFFKHIYLSKKTFNIPASVTNITIPLIDDYDCTPILAYNVHEDNPAYCSVDGVLYSKDKKSLISYPRYKDDKVATVDECVEVICENALFGGRFEEIILPESLKRIERYAFYSCVWLKELNIPASVNYIDTEAFTIPRSLKALNVDFENETYSSIDGVLYNKDKTAVLLFPTGSDLTSYTVPEGVTTVGEWAFRSFSSLDEIILPDSVETISRKAFYGCGAHVEVPENVKFFGEEAFAMCGITEAIVPEGVTEIADRAFYNNNITKVVLPKGIKSIGKEAFAWNYILESVNIPETVETIDEQAFQGCASIDEIVIPDSVKAIGKNAFEYCNENFIIYGSKGSAAHKYATENGIRFIDMNSDNLGDVNLDGYVNVKDATTIQKHLASIITLDDPALGVADYDGDTRITVRDATEIQKFIAGIK